MHKYIDTKLFVTILLAAITLFLIQKYFTKTKIGEATVKKLVGTDATGHI